MATGQDVVDYARTFLGIPYVWGGTSRSGVDCSGLVKLVFQQFGINTPRTTADMVGAGSNLQPIDRSQIQAGDLVTSHWAGETRPSSHVAIYAGDGTVIEAPQPGENVKVTKLSDGYWGHVDQVLRAPGINGAGAASGGGGGLGGTLDQLIGGVAQAAFPWVGSPKTLTDAMANVGSAAGSLAGSAMQVGHLANLATRLFLPTNILRGFLMGTGIVFILIGILFLAKEVSQS